MYIHLIAVKIRLSIHKTLAYNTVISYRTAGCKKNKNALNVLWCHKSGCRQPKATASLWELIHETDTEDFVYGTTPLFSQ